MCDRVCVCVCVCWRWAAEQHHRVRAAAVATAAAAIVAAARLCAAPASCLGVCACHHLLVLGVLGCVWWMFSSLVPQAGRAWRGEFFRGTAQGLGVAVLRVGMSTGSSVVGWGYGECSSLVFLVGCLSFFVWRGVAGGLSWLVSVAGLQSTRLRPNGAAVRAPCLTACRLCRGVSLVVQQVLFRTCASVY